MSLILDGWFWTPAALWAAAIVFGYISGFGDGQDGARHMGELGRVATTAMIVALASGLFGTFQHLRNIDAMLEWPLTLWLLVAIAGGLVPTLARSAGYARRRRRVVR